MKSQTLAVWRHVNEGARAFVNHEAALENHERSVLEHLKAAPGVRIG